MNKTKRLSLLEPIESKVPGRLVEPIGSGLYSLGAIAKALFRAQAPMIKPRLVPIRDVRAPGAYRRLQHLKEKDSYRTKLADVIKLVVGEAGHRRFIELATELQKVGAVSFSGLIDDEPFALLVKEFNGAMAKKGSKSVLHSFLNLGLCEPFLSSGTFSDAFLHPLLILMISYNVGSPVRVVDARGKHTGAMRVQAQDNMLHIDNTPYNDEYKIILTWEKDTTGGPRGQNFVYIPGTHTGARDVLDQFISTDELLDEWSEKKIAPLLENEFIVREPHPFNPSLRDVYRFDSRKIHDHADKIPDRFKSWLHAHATGFSSENGSIFIESDSVDSIFKYQKKEGYSDPTVVEVTGDKPVTTVFGAGQLVHHRHRTDHGKSRSCIIVAFHPVRYRTGAYISGYQEKGHVFSDGRLPGFENDFLRRYAVGRQHELRRALKEGVSISPTEIQLDKKGFQRWKQDVIAAPRMQQKRVENLVSQFHIIQTKQASPRYIGALAEVMKYDKHGPLDLILYPDCREECRKAARNQIREMDIEEIYHHLDTTWNESSRKVSESDLLSVKEVQSIARELAMLIKRVDPGRISMPKGSNITSKAFLISLAQLVDDLTEAATRAYDHLNWVSTILFLFWSADQVVKWCPTPTLERQAYSCGEKLLKDYVISASIEYDLGRGPIPRQTPGHRLNGLRVSKKGG